MTFLWATRGRAWGFRFLRDGGHRDPLPFYFAAFAGLGDEPSAFGRVSDGVVLRFPDPEGRRDAAGRVIPHEFLLTGPLADQVHSVADGIRVVWPLVDAEYARLWDAVPGE